VVDQHDLDAKAINAVPAIGVVIAMGLFGVAWRRGGAGERRPWQTVDTVTIALIAVLAVLALPWILAEVGVYVGDFPGLGDVFMSKQADANQREVAVHLGDHHGFNGAELAITGLVLSRAVGTLRRGWVRLALGLYVALMVVYGVANGAQDFWYEQVVKRDWATSQIPNMQRPRLAVEWGLVLIGVVAVYLVLVRRRETRGNSSAAASGQSDQALSRRGGVHARSLKSESGSAAG
jgi:hypothetical protein